MPKSTKVKVSKWTNTGSHVVPDELSLKQKLAHDAAMAILFQLPTYWTADMTTWTSIRVKMEDEIIKALDSQTDLQESQT